MQLTVKDLTKIIADSPDAAISIAVVNGVQMKIFPADQVQVLVNNANGKETRNLVIITNEGTKD